MLHSVYYYLARFAYIPVCIDFLIYFLDTDIMGVKDFLIGSAYGIIHGETVNEVAFYFYYEFFHNPLRVAGLGRKGEVRV